MNIVNDDVIWQIIGEKNFCSFKQNSKTKSFCKHKYNLTGLCFKQSCPLANSRYATVLEKEGIFYLIKKETDNFNFPNRLWKKIILSRNFLKAIQQINLHLAFWPKFFLHYAKVKLTKIKQIFVRYRMIQLKKTKEFRIEETRNMLSEDQKKKIPTNLEIQKSIESELLNRLNLGVYGKLYRVLPIHIEKANKIIAPKKKNLKLEKIIETNIENI